MKRSLVALAVVFLEIICTNNTKAQGFYSAINTNMIGFELVGHDNISTDPERPIFVVADDVKAYAINIGGMIGFELPLYKFSDDLALGTSLNIGIGFLGSPKLAGINAALAIDFPEYLTLWYGSRPSFDDSKLGFGLGLGLGYSYTYTALPYHSPNVMVDIATSGGWLFRLNANILKYTYYYYYTSEGDIPAAKISQFGLQIIYAM